MATRMYVCDSTEHPSTLLSGLNEQRLKGVLCDVTVRVQGNLFKAHINVLASSMGYFRDLFVSSSKEKPHSVIDIPMIVNTTGFAKILDFVYTSQLCLSQSTVMQVLCSACYLQIPYVVEKCQEFIGTHGHVTTPSSLQEVTAPILQGLQNGGFPKLSSGHLNNQSASASLSFLSQLNRLSEKSRTQLALQQHSRLNQSSSPNNPQREGEDQQECTLINTPPSPADRSPSNSDINRHSPNSQVPKDATNLSATSLKQSEHDVNGGSNDEKMLTNSYSPPNKFSHLTGVNEGETASKRFEYSLNQDAQNLRDVIDHKSLAAYFSSADRDKIPVDSLFPYPYRFNGQQEKKEKRLVDLTKTTKRDRTVEKKERPKKEYRCDYCGKLFGRQQHLKRHILTHTGERPYPCTYCDKRFRRSEHLKHHLANHEQALGLEPTIGRKKPRKATRADDAYTMSKMMLGQYGATDVKPHVPMIEYGSAPPSAPVILPSMLVDQEAANNSPQVQATEADNGNVPPSDNNDERLDNQQRSPSSYNEQSPMTALNLCRDVPKSTEDSSMSMSLQNGLSVLDDVDRPFDDGKMPEADQASVESRPSSANATDAYDDVHVSNGIIGMEGSEVVTHDLKRLIAAMDK